MTDEIATTPGEEHADSPPKVIKVKEISAKDKEATPKLVVNHNAIKCALKAYEIVTTSGEEHVSLPPKVSKVKEISAKGPKSCTKLVANQNATKRALLAE